MAKGDVISLEGIVQKVLPNALFKVKLETGSEILGHISGKMRQNKIQILEGDRVHLEISPYDVSKGRIVFRDK
jgi:translation initiation factor IF-1